jgi:hypothetical protein
MTKQRAATAAVLAGLALLGLAGGVYAADATVAGTTNIALAANGGRIVAVSGQAKDDNGQVMPNWQAANAIDGLFVVGTHTPPSSYGWSTNTPPTADIPHWIVIGFGAEGKEKTHLISRVVIDPTTDDPFYIGRWAKTVEVQLSNTEKDGPYRSVGTFLVINKPIKQAFDFPPSEGRFLRLIIKENHGSDRCVELGEIEAYEAIIGQNQLDELIIRLENLLTDLKRYRDGALYQQNKAALESVTRKDAPPATAPEPAPVAPPQ